jgi:hypothetical protein
MTLILVAIVAILVLLVLIRVSSKAGATVTSSAKPTRERRSGRDRRLRRVHVPRERRRAPRRFEDVASTYVARIDGSRKTSGHRPGPRS